MKNILFLSLLSISILSSCSSNPSKDEALKYYNSIMEPYLKTKTEAKRVNSESLAFVKKYINTKSGKAPHKEYIEIEKKLNSFLSNLAETKNKITKVKSLDCDINLIKETSSYLDKISQLYDKNIRFVVKMLDVGIDNFEEEDLAESLAKIQEIEILNKKYNKTLDTFHAEFNFTEADYK